MYRSIRASLMGLRLSRMVARVMSWQSIRRASFWSTGKRGGNYVGRRERIRIEVRSRPWARCGSKMSREGGWKGQVSPRPGPRRVEQLASEFDDMDSAPPEGTGGEGVSGRGCGHLLQETGGDRLETEGGVLREIEILHPASAVCPDGILTEESQRHRGPASAQPQPASPRFRQRYVSLPSASVSSC